MSYGMQGAYSSQRGNIGPTGKSGNVTPKGYKLSQTQNFTPEMMDFFSQLIEQLGPESFLAKIAGGDQSAFEEMEEPALRQFGELQGGLASKFSQFGGKGAMSSRGSSGFQNSMNAASQDFASQLAGKRNDYRMNAIKELQSMGNQLLNQKPYDTQLVKKPAKWWESFGPIVGNLANKGTDAAMNYYGLGG